jgi:phosphatidylserine/phosphatidylglycerophosphate/cardiolipin synthase-like enzyme
MDNLNHRDNIEVTFLCEGCQTDADIATKLANYLKQATRTIDIAIYSFSLCPEARSTVMGALTDRRQAGVAIRIAYDAGSQQESIAEANLYQDPCALDTRQFIQELGLPSKPIEGYRALMHHKYAIVDAGTPNAQVWTGSTNWTDDSWNLQENNILILRSPEVADYYTQDFNELWVDANIASSGVLDRGDVTLRYGGQLAESTIAFSPLEGEWINDTLADIVRGAKQRLTMAAVVVTSSKIIDALQEIQGRGVTIEGIYDRTQMEGVKYQWSLVPNNNWKIGVFEKLAAQAGLVGKVSTPYTPESKHDFMHNKVLVVDDTVITGSYNFSRHAQQNAENVLIISSAPLAALYRDYIHGLMRRYAPQAKEAPTPVAVRQDPNI